MFARGLKFTGIFLLSILLAQGSIQANEKKPNKETTTASPAATPSGTTTNTNGNSAQSGNKGQSNSGIDETQKVQTPTPAPTTTSQPVEIVKNSQPSEPSTQAQARVTPEPSPSVSLTATASQPSNSSTGDKQSASSSSDKSNSNAETKPEPQPSTASNPRTESQPKPEPQSSAASAATPSPQPSPSPKESSIPNTSNRVEEKVGPNQSAQPTPSSNPLANIDAQSEKSPSSNQGNPKTSDAPKSKDVGAVTAANSKSGVDVGSSRKTIVSASTLKNPKLIAGELSADQVNASAKELEFKAADNNCGIPAKPQTLTQSSTKAASTKSAKSSSNAASTTGANSFAEEKPEECKDFMLVFTNDSTKADIDAAAQNAKGKVLKNFSNVFKGALVNGPVSKILALAKNPKVKAIEADGFVKSQEIYSNPVWGLDRVDQRLLPLNSSYDDLNNSGNSIPIYIVDSGIYAEHTEFSGRVAPGVTSIADGYGTWDCNGHGTHVSGIAAGSNYGLAKSATLIPVRVLGCNGSGTYSGVVAGLDWIAANHPMGVPGVVNMSLGGPISTSLDTAVENLISRGLTVVVAAGNAGADACSYSPARVPGAITVAATSIDDSRASYSNFGSCVDVFAPGTSITSAWINGVTGSAIASGTSMASPYVAGAVARFLYLNKAATPSQVSNSLVLATTTDVVLNPGTGTANRLLYIDFAPAPTVEPSPSPTPTKSKKANPGKGNKP